MTTTTNEIELTGTELNQQRVLVVKFGRISKPAASMADASAQYRNHIEANDLGASGAANCFVFEAGKKVARVSYNGRVWSV
jgi:hypothetical protein